MINIIETVYAFGFFNGKFHELGKCVHVKNELNLKYDYAFPYDTKFDKGWRAGEYYVYSNYTSYKIDKEANKVYKHRIVYLLENDASKAIELFKRDFKSDAIEKMDKAQETYNKRLEAFKEYENDQNRK